MRKAIALFAVLLAGAACSSSTATGMGGGPAPDEVFLLGSSFTPVTRTVSAGTTVHFLNQAGISHNVTSSAVPVGASTFSSGNFTTNYQVTLTVPGTYQYFCSLHGTASTGMHATIVVN